MSAGAFVRTKYEADDGTIYSAIAQPETLAATFGANDAPNNPPAGAFTGNGRAKLRGGRRTLGVNGRLAYVKWTGSVPTGYKQDSVLSIPILQQVLFDALVANETVGNYLGNPIIVVGKSPERRR